MKILYLFVSLLFCTALTAQQSGKISGIIKSPENNGVDAATISLFKTTDTSLVKIAVSDKNGIFQFENITHGKYQLNIEAVGYQKFTTPAFEVSSAKPSVQVNEIKLIHTEKDLNNVSVNAVRPLIENKIDKTVVNVDASPTNTGLSALEVLEKSPGVTVDNDGNISLKGKQGVRIMIDGKPAYLSGQDLTNYLKNMPSNQLDQIEIMTQPPAKYDAAGNTGIINFKTKKNKNNGLNGSVTTSAIFARYFKNTNSINFNWRQNKINLFGNYGYSHWEGFNEIMINRRFRKDSATNFNRYVEQNTFGRFSGRFHNYKAGVDFFASSKTTAGLSINGFIEDTKFGSNSVANIFDSTQTFVQYNTASSQTHDPWKNIGFNFNLQQKLDDKGGEISTDADYILYRTKGNQYSYNYLYNSDDVLVADPAAPNPYLLNGYLPANIDIYSFKTDYTQPLKNNTSLEAGLKLSYVKTDNDAQYTLYDTSLGKWVADAGRSNHFIYKENINAAYLTLQKQMKKITVKLGLRAEQTIADGNQVTKELSFHKNYTKLFPTAYFSYQPNDSNTFVVSYGRRIERPSYQDLNPFQFQLDRYTYRQGNPDLQPQFSHNIELSYNYKNVWNFSANYTSVTDIINDVLITEKDGENYSTFITKRNIASSKNIGLSVNYGKQINKWWNLNVFGNVYYNQFEGFIGEEYIDISLVSFNSNMTSRFTFNKGWTAEISGFYNAKNLESSNIVAQPMGMFSLGAGKQVLNNKGTIRLNVRDPFYVMRFRGSTELNTFVTNIRSKWDNRRVILTLTYRFGKANGQSQRRRTAAEEEQNRVNTGGGGPQ